jgi:hypothetical protein
MRKIKAQAAMEYLMTYGWAILVVIVVVAALYAMGVFRIPGAPVPCSPCFSKFAFIGYTKTAGYGYTNDGALKIRSGAEEIDITSLTPATLVLRVGGTNQELPYRASPGTELELANISTTGNVVITIGYTVTATGYSYTDTATIRN